MDPIFISIGDTMLIRKKDIRSVLRDDKVITVRPDHGNFLYTHSFPSSEEAVSAFDNIKKQLGIISP
ncbi:MAG: hypothetical protein COB73_04920 [Flavobacteriaceae bacterium]|nr:MAG: hypothetical protein COB73_04920 [Flavobacteriaceae bacterium]